MAYPPLPPYFHAVLIAMAFVMVLVAIIFVAMVVATILDAIMMMRDKAHLTETRMALQRRWLPRYRGYVPRDADYAER